MVLPNAPIPCRPQEYSDLPTRGPRFLRPQSLHRHHHHHRKPLAGKYIPFKVSPLVITLPSPVMITPKAISSPIIPNPKEFPSYPYILPPFSRHSYPICSAGPVPVKGLNSNCGRMHLLSKDDEGEVNGDDSGGDRAVVGNISGATQLGKVSRWMWINRDDVASYSWWRGQSLIKLPDIPPAWCGGAVSTRYAAPAPTVRWVKRRISGIQTRVTVPVGRDTVPTSSFVFKLRLCVLQRF